MRPDTEILMRCGATVVGANGFLGGHLRRVLESTGIPVLAVGRSPIPKEITDLGVIYYCAGRAGNFLDHPADTVDGHAGLLIRLLTGHDFTRLVYVSSTRLYLGAPATTEETPIPIQPAQAGSLYDIAKLLGENFTLNQTGGRGVVLRVSTIIDPTFRSQSILRTYYQAALHGEVLALRTPPDAARDLIDVEDVVNALIALGTQPKVQGIFNVASGINVSNAELVEVFGRFRDLRVDYTNADREYRSPAPIDITKLLTASDVRPTHPLTSLTQRLSQSFSS